MLTQGRLSFESFLAAPHVTVSPSSDSGIQLDDILRAMGFDRRIVASVPHYLAIPPLIAGTDLIAHSRRKLVDVFRSSKRLHIMPVPVPFEVPDLVFAQVWHGKYRHDGAHSWLRSVIIEVLQD
jgi:DNA-binding transcriptional LysR family regulator